MATATQASRFLNDLGATLEVFDEDEIDEIFEMAAETYPGNTVAMENRARIIGLRRLLAHSAKMVTYTANASEEQLSDIFKALERLLKSYVDEADKISASGIGIGPGVRFGALHKTPSTIVENPDA